MTNTFETKFHEKTGIEFNKFYHEQKPKLVYHLMKLINDKEIAEDFAEETFIVSLQKLDQYDKKRSKIQTWMYKIGMNLVRKDYKDNNKLPLVSIEKTTKNDLKIINILTDDNTSELETKAENKKRAKLSKSIIKKLPDKYSEIMHLREIEKWKYKDIAKHLNIPLGTLKCRIKKGRDIIRHKLQKKNIIMEINGNE